MTLYLLDIASYQAGLNLTKAKAAGFSLVNIKTSEGMGYTHAAARSWADKARKLDLGICTFHWLDKSGSGRAQADIAYRHMRELGGPDGMAHQLDCEDDASQAQMRDYVARMQDLLGRHIVIYTGDWWWKPRGWSAASLTPYLWAAPNAGYVKSYPGDTSAAWRAGYGGWGDYSILQYAVAPISGAGGGDISKSAIRDPQVWAALTGTAEDEMSTRAEGQIESIFNAVFYGGTSMGRKVAKVNPTSVGNGLVDKEDYQVTLLESILAAIKGDSDTAEILARIDQRAAELRAGLVADVLAALPEAGPVSREDLEAALRTVLGSVDGASPTQG